MQSASRLVSPIAAVFEKIVPTPAPEEPVLLRKPIIDAIAECLVIPIVRSADRQIIIALLEIVGLGIVGQWQQLDIRSVGGILKPVSG